MADESVSRHRSAPAPAMEATGFRVTPATRRALEQAATFTNSRSVQAVLELAVSEFLARFEREVPGFADARSAAEKEVNRRSRGRR